MKTDWARLSETLWARSGGACERCGCGLISPDHADRHHRRLRSGGGKHGITNLVLLCPTCHHRRVHAYPTIAMRDGWIVSRYREPADVPVYLARYGWVLLTPDGGVTPAAEAA